MAACRLSYLTLAATAAVALSGRALGDGVLHPPAPAPVVTELCPTVPVPCPVSCPTAAPACPTPKIELIVPPPNVRVVTGGYTGAAGGGVCKTGACEKAPAGKDCGHTGSKACSFLNFSITKIKGGGGAGVGGPTQTTVVPAFATATIPIALQTTRTITGVSESAFVGGARGFSRADLAEAVREAMFQNESLRRPESDLRRAESDLRTEQDSCKELRLRVEKVEKRLDEIEKSVQKIAEKLK